MRIRFEGEQGQGLTEYGLILVLEAIVVMVVLATFGRRLSMVYEEINCAFTNYPVHSGPLTITASGRKDADSVWMTFNLASASQVVLTDLPSGFSESFYLSPQQYTWYSDDESGQGYASLGSGLITAMTPEGAYACGKYPAEQVAAQ